jgi:hypothetical protein
VTQQNAGLSIALPEIGLFEVIVVDLAEKVTQ